MDSVLRARLRALPSLGAEKPGQRVCKICERPAIEFTRVDLNKFCSRRDYHAFGFAGIDVAYYRCTYCQLLFTGFFDDWSSADFAEFIYNKDYVQVDGEYVSARPTRTAEFMADHLHGLEAARMLDYGGGNGMFAARMRERGFRDITTYDPFSQPERPSGLFDLLFTFEVIEHSPTPLATFADIISFMADGGCVIVGQTLQPDDIDAIRGSWWYLAPRNGHVSTYTLRSFEEIMWRFGLDFYAFGGTLFGFGKGDPSPATGRAIAQLGGAALRVHRLRAPDVSTESSAWGDVEFSHLGPFRWTRQPVVAWGVRSLVKGTNRFKLEFINTITAEFPDQAVLMLDDQAIPLQRDGQILFADVVMDTPALRHVALRTPPLPSPREVHGIPDDRALGLGIAV